MDCFQEQALSDSLKVRVRTLLKSYLTANVDALGDATDLFANGLSSAAAVNLMLALEQAFGIEFPDELLRRRTFASIDAIAGVLTQIGVKQGAA